jgi:hypothetical protein
MLYDHDSHDIASADLISQETKKDRRVLEKHIQHSEITDFLKDAVSEFFCNSHKII